MKMIDVYMKMARFEIELGTKLVIGDYTFEYVEHWSSSEACFSYGFEDEKEKTLEDYYDIDLKFLNKVIELIPPKKEKKYFIKVNVRGLCDETCYVNYNQRFGYLYLGIEDKGTYSETQFTKREMKEIIPIKGFLEDIQGKYELIEVE